jgi:hypothetical protein
MIRNLLVITGVGFLLALVGIGGAFALVGNDIRTHDWTWVVTDDEPGDSGFRLERGEVRPDVTRTIEWAGGDRLAVDVTGDVTYVQGLEAGIRVTGPKDIVDRIRFTDGRLSLINDDRGDRGYIRWTGTGVRAWSESEALKIVVTAPSVKTFEMGDYGRLKIRDFDQPSLDLILQGDGDIRVDGRADKVAVTVHGDGGADLDDLRVAAATIAVEGGGDVRVGPTDRADIDISGRGDVILTRNPAQVNQSITGWGEVEIN